MEAEFSLAAISTVCLQVRIQSLLGPALSIFLGCYIISLPRVQKCWSFIPTVYHLTFTAQHPSHDQLAIWFCSRFWNTEGWWALAGVDFGDKHRMKRSNKKKKKKRSRSEARRPNVRYQLLLTWHKSLKTGGHTKSQLVNEGRLVLAVDLNLDACFVGGLICGYSRPEKCNKQNTVAPRNLPFGCGTDNWALVNPEQQRYSHVGGVGRRRTDLQAVIYYMPFTLWMQGSVLLLSAINWRQCVNEHDLLGPVSAADVEKCIGRKCD